MADDGMDKEHPYETDGLRQMPLSSESLKKLFSESSDIIFRDIFIGRRLMPFQKRPLFGVTLAYVDGLANTKIIDDNIVCPLTKSDLFKTCCSLSEAFQIAQGGALQVSAIGDAKDTAKAIDAMLSGKTLLCFDPLHRILILDTVQFEKRGIESAKEESTYRTAKESFVEALRVNTSMLRRKIGSASLVLEETMVGRQSNTRVCIAYMRNICNETLISLVRERIKQINQDKVLSLRDIEVHVTQYKYTILPTALVTEKADVCIRQLLEGKIVVIVDDLPYALIFPAVFGDFFKSAEDYSVNSIFSTAFRILRYICLLLSIITPGFYVSLVLYHPEMVPYELANRIATANSGVPFPVYIEAIVMALAFLALLQASIMISQTVGSAISIVGGLVLGQAVIVAGFISPGVIVVIAVASICSLAIPSKEFSSLCWVAQIACTIACSVIGLAGLVLTFLTLLYLMARLAPMGIPYLTPHAGTRGLQLHDSFVLFPDEWNKERPMYLDPKNKRRIP